MESLLIFVWTLCVSCKNVNYNFIYEVFKTYDKGSDFF